MNNRINLEKSKFHLLAVSVAAELSSVKKQGKAISLEAMNAKILVVRAGTLALGFKPLTDFMGQLAADIIELVQQIEAEALTVAHQAVVRLRTSTSVSLATRAYRLGCEAEARWGGELERFVVSVKKRDEATVEKLLEDARRLIHLLDQITAKMTAASAVSTSFRIESASIEERYSQSFQIVADNLDLHAAAILNTVKSNTNLLRRELRN